jgi:hypothetical protein
MKKLSMYPWRMAYVSAILEIDDAQITERIYEAIAAIELRRLSPWKIDDDERQSLDAAEAGIQALVTERNQKASLECAVELPLSPHYPFYPVQVLLHRFDSALHLNQCALDASEAGEDFLLSGDWGRRAFHDLCSFPRITILALYATLTGLSENPMTLD